MIKSFLRSVSKMANFIAFYSIIFGIFNVSFFTWGWFYYLKLNPIEWSGNARGFIAISNIVMIFMSYVGFILNEKDLTK